jgi:hypothetical protein
MRKTRDLHGGFRGYFEGIESIGLKIANGRVKMADDFVTMDVRTARGRGNPNGQPSKGVYMRSMLRKRAKNGPRVMTSTVEFVVGSDMQMLGGFKIGDRILIQTGQGAKRGFLKFVRTDGTDPRAKILCRTGQNGRAGVMNVPKEWVWDAQVAQRVDCEVTQTPDGLLVKVPSHALPAVRSRAA